MKVAIGGMLEPRENRILSQIGLLVLFASLLTSCAHTSEMIRPSDKIGKMRVNRYGHSNAQSIWEFCSDAMTDEPGIQTTECKVPMVSELFLGLGCVGKDKLQRDSCWAARTWELTIDGYPIDLNAFNIADFDEEREGTQYHHRVWRIRLRDLTEGNHSLHYVIQVNQQVDDGTPLQPGTYELLVNFTVEK